MTTITAHRGFSGCYPENTMLAFQKAVEIGADGIELDVHLSRDGELVITHDENLRRVSGRAGFVKDYTAEELGRIDVSNGFPLEHGMNPVPTLRTYFSYMKDKPLFTNIELKNTRFSYVGMEEKLLKLVRAYDMADRVVFSSFNHDSMLRIKELCPDAFCAFLFGAHLRKAGLYAKSYGIDGINPQYTYLNDTTIAETHAEGVAIQAWTVDEAEDMRYLMGKNIRSIITDRPDIALRVRAEMAREDAF